MVSGFAPTDQAARGMDGDSRSAFGLDETTAQSGKILFSGPTTDRKYGVYVIRAESRSEAEQIAGGDPCTVAGFTAFELLEWEVHQIMGVGAFTAAEMRAHR